MEIEKPKDWPANDRERFLDEVVRLLRTYIAHPSTEVKDALVDLSCDYDYQQKLMLGICWVTDYEVALVNSIYQAAQHYFFGFLKARLYEIVADVALMEKFDWQFASLIPGRDAKPCAFVEAYGKLEKPLKLFYFAYQEYICLKGSGLAKYIIRNVRNLYECKSLVANLQEIAMAFSLMLMDLSILRGTPNEREIQFDRKELTALFAEEAKLLALSGASPCVSPFCGVLKIQISNFILLSRSGYHDGVSYKCIHTGDAQKSWANGQLWLRRTELLNDSREGQCLRELLNELPEMGYKWATAFKLKPTRRYWVSSFTKRFPDEEFRKCYGHAVYGFKGDRPAELIAPLMKRHWVCNDRTEAYDDYALSQVVCLDVLYDKEKAKAELRFLCATLDRFKMSPKEKQAFLEDILQYWMLSVKDPQWKVENERRYVLFDHFGDEYLDVVMDDKFLKIKTNLLKHPDFIVPPHPLKKELGRYARAIAANEMSGSGFYCEDCLNRDYELVLPEQTSRTCSICGSKRMRFVSARKCGKIVANQ